MANKLKVAWFNGLNIQKIHFEQQERYFERNIDTKTIAISNNLYGIIDIRFSNEMLMQGKIALEKVIGIAKDGSIFDAPEQDLLPEAISAMLVAPSGIFSVTMEFSNSKYISLKSIIASRIYDDNDSAPKDLSDERDEQNMTFTQEKTNLILASIRLKLGILGDSTPDELEIPIAKIKQIDSNKKIQLEENFIPTCLNINQSPIIKAFLGEMLFSIKRHKEILGEIFKGIDQTKNTLDFNTYLSLNLLKKWFLIFSALANKEKLHPESLYDKLLEFQGEIGAFGAEDSLLEFISYNHNNLNETFLPLINNLKILFSKITSPRYSMAKIIDNGNGFYDFMFDNAKILEEAEIFIAVNADVSYEYLLKNFKSQSKIHTQSNIKHIVVTQLKGLNITQIPNVPSALPYLNGYVYYKLDKKDELFKHFKGESVISLYLTHNIKSPDIKMWAVF